MQYKFENANPFSRKFDIVHLQPPLLKQIELEVAHCPTLIFCSLWSPCAGIKGLNSPQEELTPNRHSEANTMSTSSGKQNMGFVLAQHWYLTFTTAI